MVKKHVYHFNRGMLIGLEIMGLFAIAVFIGWLYLIIRLSQGPMDVDFLTRRIEASLNSQQSGFAFSVGSTLLTWGGGSQPFMFEMNNVQIHRSDKTPVLAVEKIGMQLSKRRMVFGQFVPRVIKIYSPALRVVRGEDGQLMLNVGSAATAPAPESEPAPESSAAGHTEFLKNLLNQMNSRDLGLLGGLRQVSITDAALMYEDRALNVGWKSKKSDIIFTRQRGGLMVDITSNIDAAPDQNTYVRGSFYYSWHTRRSNGTLYFSGVNPSRIAQDSERLKDLAGIDLTLKGSVSVETDTNLNPGFGRFVLGADAGSFRFPGLYDTPLPVTKAYLQGKFNAASKEALIEQISLNLSGPKLEARAAVVKRADDHVVQVQALLTRMPMDILKSYWPEKLAHNPRDWVTKHLSVGTATRATLNLTLLAPGGDFNSLQTKVLNGAIDFTGIKVEYFPPLMPVLNAGGTATYDHKSFNLDIKSGALGDMKVTKSKIAITDLDIQSDTVNSNIDIDVSLSGPLRTALKVLNSKPLEYPKELGIRTTDVDGTAQVDVNFKFPLNKNLLVEDVRVAAKAKLENVLLKDMVAGLPLSGGPLDLSVNNDAMTVKGKGLLGTMPVDFNWLKNFSEKAEISDKVEAKLPLDEPALAAFGVPDTVKMGGSLPADIVYTARNNHTATLFLKGNITPAALSLPDFNYAKPAGETGALDLTAHFKNGALTQISGLSLSSNTAHVKGSLDFLSDGKSMKKANFSQVRMGDTDIALSATRNGSSGYAVKVTGRQFDATQFLSDKKAAGSDEAAAIPSLPFALSMTIERLITGKDRHVDKIRLYMKQNEWRRIEQMEVDGKSGGKPLRLRYLPTAKGHSLQMEADNAGAALSALGVSNDVRGGKIIVSAAPDSKGGKRDLKGYVAISDFTLVNMPVLGRLLNGLSPMGLIELLNGKGIAFKKTRADFWWIDRGMPDSKKNMRLIKVKDGQTSGASLGLTFDGTIDQWTHTLDIDGTIIPVSDLNKLIGSIPIVGTLLTGGGGGVFAATYTIKGPKADPTVTVNPLSVLAPGILRKLFFEK